MKKHISDTIQNARFLPLRLIAEGLVVGIVSGLIVMLYRIALTHAESILSAILTFTKDSLLKMCGWFLVLSVIAFLVARLVQWEPMISGSGIPQLEGEMSGKLNQVWWKVLPAKFLGGFLCLVSGLSLGREGPSIQLGAMTGKGVSKLLSLSKSEEKYLLTCGASAGLSAAFHAPLAGVLFSLEEIHKNFSVSVLITAMTASVTADFLTSGFLGNNPVFSFMITEDLPLQYYGFILALGLMLGVFGAFYNWFTLKMQSLYQNSKFQNPFVKLLIPFFLAGILGYTCPVLLGSGGNLITGITDGNLGIQAALLLLIAKFLYSGICFGSGAPGGIFFPLLVLGGLSGGIFALTLSTFFGLPTEYINNFVLLSMAGYFTAIVRAPLTGIILIFEMTGSLSQLASLTLVSISAYIVAAILKSEPIYESLLTRILDRQGHEIPDDHHDKILKEYVIMHNSPLSGLAINQIHWPTGALIIEIKRGQEQILPTGSTKLEPSDILFVIIDESKEGEAHDVLSKLCSEQEAHKNPHDS